MEAFGWITVVLVVLGLLIIWLVRRAHPPVSEDDPYSATIEFRPNADSFAYLVQMKGPGFVELWMLNRRPLSFTKKASSVVIGS